MVMLQSPMAFLKLFQAGWLVSDSEHPRSASPTEESHIKLKARCWALSSSATNFRIRMSSIGPTHAWVKSSPGFRTSRAGTLKWLRSNVVIIWMQWLMVRRMTWSVGRQSCENPVFQYRTGSYLQKEWWTIKNDKSCFSSGLIQHVYQLRITARLFSSLKTS